MLLRQGYTKQAQKLLKEVETLERSLVAALTSSNQAHAKAFARLETLSEKITSLERRLRTLSQSRYGR